MEITRMKVTYYQEEVPKSIEEFKEWSFSSGATTGQDFRVFARMFKNHLAGLIRPKGLRIVNCSLKNHYFVSGFVTNGQQYVYFSVSDVRFFPGKWYKEILIRRAKDEHDYTGERNHYCSLDNFQKAVCELM